MRNLFSVQRDLIFPIYFLGDHVWQHVILRRCGEDLAGTRIQSGDLIGGLLYVLDSYRHAARDLGEPVPAEVFHVLGNNSVLDTVFFSLSPQLNQQTLAQIARANSRRIKCLD